jgi:hypothetical protein
MSKLWRPRHAAEILGVERRVFIAAGGAALAGLALSGCNRRPSGAVARFLARSERFNQPVEGALYRHTAMK